MLHSIFLNCLSVLCVLVHLGIYLKININRFKKKKTGKNIRNKYVNKNINKFANIETSKPLWVINLFW